MLKFWNFKLNLLLYKNCNLIKFISFIYLKSTWNKYIEGNKAGRWQQVLKCKSPSAVCYTPFTGYCCRKWRLNLQAKEGSSCWMMKRTLIKLQSGHWLKLKNSCFLLVFFAFLWGCFLWITSWLTWVAATHTQTHTHTWFKIKRKHMKVFGNWEN